MFLLALKMPIHVLKDIHIHIHSKNDANFLINMLFIYWKLLISNLMKTKLTFSYLYPFRLFIFQIDS